MNSLDWETIGVIVSLVVAIGTAIASFVTVSYRLGMASQRLEDMEDAVNSDIKPELKELRKSIDLASKRVSSRIDALLKDMALSKVSVSKSPRVLNEYGKKILAESNISAVIDNEYDTILKEVKANGPENAYQVEQQVLSAVQRLQEDDELRNVLEEGAFNTGTTVDTVLLVGGLYVRDRVLDELKMKPEEIDQHMPNKKTRKKS